MMIVVLIAAVLGLYMAWNIGANDVANSMADAVGSKAISIKRAIIAAAICEFAGAVLVGSHVTETVRSGIVSPKYFENAPETLALGMVCALLAAAVWLHAATWFGMPVSTTHSIIGAVTGFGIVAMGWGAINWGVMGTVVASWFISPVVGGLAAFIIFKLINRHILGTEAPARAAVRWSPLIVFAVAVTVLLATLYKGLKHVIPRGSLLNEGWASLSLACVVALVLAIIARLLIAPRLKQQDGAPLGQQLEWVEALFGPLVIITSCSVAFAHGANDVANAVGPLAAVVDIMRSGLVKARADVPFWVLSIGGIGIVIGLSTYGYRVMQTVGSKITQLTPSRGVAADLAATATVLVCSRMGLPISTTHTLVGAILGVGFARGLGAVNRRVTTNIFGSWLITVPAAAGVCIILFLAGRLLGADHLIARLIEHVQS